MDFTQAPKKRTSERSPHPLLASEAHALFRVAQEALTNVGRHAAAKRATVVLDYRAAETPLAIDDDGRGMGEAVFGVGLTGMAERLARLHGSLEVLRSGAGGVGVRATLPPRERAARLASHDAHDRE